MRHKNRTEKGDILRIKHQITYNKWWLGKYIKSPSKFNGKSAIGKITKVEYIGNSVYGIVKIYLDNGCEFMLSSRDSFRPRKSDLEVFEKL